MPLKISIKAGELTIKTRDGSMALPTKALRMPPESMIATYRTVGVQHKSPKSNIKTTKWNP
jgi:hypothetical protein